jgi:hypothetical protein
MSTPRALSEQVPTDSLKTIASALPSSLANKVITSQVEQVFVWVIKDSDNAAKIVSILQDSGFKNIQVDSKGTTITALAGGLLDNNAPVEKPVVETAPEPTTEPTTEPTSSTFGATAADEVASACDKISALINDCSDITNGDDCKRAGVIADEADCPTMCKWSNTNNKCYS